MINKVNEVAAEALAGILSSMWTFWILVALVWGSLLFQLPTGAQGWVQWIVQSFFQGVALPVLAFVAKLEGAKTIKMLQETHDAAIAEHNDTQEMLKEMKELLAK